jgi:hypothetical protein
MRDPALSKQTTAPGHRKVKVRASSGPPVTAEGMQRLALCEEWHSYAFWLPVPIPTTVRQGICPNLLSLPCLNIDISTSSWFLVAFIQHQSGYCHASLSLPLAGMALSFSNPQTWWKYQPPAPACPPLTPPQHPSRKHFRHLLAAKQDASI